MPKPRSTVWALVVFVGLGAVGPVPAQQADGVTELRREVEQLRRAGCLEDAIGRLREFLSTPSRAPAEEFAVRIVMARLLDRHGLHHGTRPTPAARAQLDSARWVAGHGPAAEQTAALELALAEHWYGDGLANGDFTVSLDHAERARRRFREIGDAHGEAEAVHRLGLIAFQQQQAERAASLLELADSLDRSVGTRVEFQADLVRHVGFLHQVRGDSMAALQAFRGSLELRRFDGTIDGVMFAALTLASWELRLGHVAAARKAILPAIAIAERLRSPVGTIRAYQLLGELLEHDGDRPAAAAAYGVALDAAVAIDHAAGRRRAEVALRRVDG